ncbi:MAG: apolipoprotein N-acyltransferase [bacterium]
MKIKTKTYILGLMSGILLALSYPPFPFHYLAFFGFIPLLYALEERNGEKSFWLIYLNFFLYHTITNWWIGSWQPNADPFLIASGVILSFFHPLFFLVPVYAYLFIRKKLGTCTALWLFPFLWTAFEWLHSLGEMSYPWLTIGYTQAYNPLWIQIADISGIWGVSFLIILINSLIARIFIMRDSYHLSFASYFKSGKAGMFFLLIVILVILPYIYGLIRTNEFIHANLLKNNKTVKIGIIQPNINPWAKWEKNVLLQVTEHLRIQDSILKVEHDIELFLWPETAIPYYDFNLNSTYNFGIVRNWVENNNISILTGFADIKLYRTNEKAPITAKKLEGVETMSYESFNAAVMLNPDYTAPSKLQIYHKMKLTPFSERFPYGQYLSFATDWFKWGVGISSWNTGERQFLLILKKDGSIKQGGDEIPIGAVICIESVYPDFTREYINEGAEVLAVITNDAWFDHTFGPEQHFIMSQVRAIETRRYIARCANSGLSGFISATGERIELLEQYKETARAGKLPLLKDKSIYVRYGDALVYICTIISLLFIFWGIIYRKK